MRGLQADPSALEIARLVDEHLQPIDTLLFGSRARGDWSEASDVDLCAIVDNIQDARKRRAEALQIGRERAAELYGRPVWVDLLLYSVEEFEYLRQARTHVTCDVSIQGVSIRRRGAEDYHYGEPDEPVSWPDVNHRFHNAQRHLDDAEKNLNAGASRETAGFLLQLAMENALRGALAHDGYDGKSDGNEGWERSHDSLMLQEKARGLPTGARTLFDRDFSQLTNYAVKFRYDEREFDLEESQVFNAVKGTIEHMMEIIEEETGMSFDDYLPDGAQARRTSVGGRTAPSGRIPPPKRKRKAECTWWRPTPIRASCWGNRRWRTTSGPRRMTGQPRSANPAADCLLAREGQQ